MSTTPAIEISYVETKNPKRLYTRQRAITSKGKTTFSFTGYVAGCFENCLSIVGDGLEKTSPKAMAALERVMADYPEYNKPFSHYKGKPFYRFKVDNNTVYFNGADVEIAQDPDVKIPPATRGQRVTIACFIDAWNLGAREGVMLRAFAVKLHDFETRESKEPSILLFDEDSD